MEALLNTFLTQSNQNIDLTITIKGKKDREKTYLTILVSEGMINKTYNDLEITAEIVSRPRRTELNKRVVMRPNRNPSLPTLDEDVPVETVESINGLLV